ncbi:MAG TPA: hypothetical protein VMW25_05325 [Clostridia bacterium]|nr:hypothetical protein [Clostridia bacterium]
MKALSSAILKTLAYADSFDYPLTSNEIWYWLITPYFFSLAEVKKKLIELKKQGRISQKEKYYFLSGREEITLLREQREKFSKPKLEIAQKTVAKLKTIPFIKMIGVSGALAMNNARKDDDIDLMIITAKNQLWLSRIIIFLLSAVLGIKRRKPADREVKDKICFNLFLDENQLKVEPENLFLAHEICQLKPLYNKDQTYEKFLYVNQWVKKFLPNVRKKFVHQRMKPKNSWFDCFFIILNKIAFWLQYQYMKPKMTTEKVGLHQAFFHPRRTRAKSASP